MENKAGKELYSLRESYGILFDALRMLPTLKQNEKDKVISKEFQERLMLAVTEVNGCAMCSYAHTKMALESGMSADEIGSILSGELGNVPSDELSAVFFAQHYADSRGKPSKKAWDQLVHVYGKQRSKAILGSVRMIMLGNAYGIPIGSLRGRLNEKKKKYTDARSGIVYEISMLVSFPFFLLFALVHAIIFSLLHGDADPL